MMDSSCKKFVEDLVACHYLFGDFIKSVSEDWHPASPPITILFAALGRGLGEVISISSENQLQEMSSRIEAAFVSGTPELKEAIGAGLLESLSIRLNKGDDCGNKFLFMLGAESARHVKAWIGEKGT